MNESRARELFLDHHRGSLSAADEAELRAVLTIHPVLQREFDELAATLHAIDAMPIPPPTARLRASVLAAIDAEKRASQANSSPASAARRTPPLTSPRLATGWRWLGRIAAGCALLMVGYFVGTHREPALALPDGREASNPGQSSQGEIADLRRQVEAMSELVSHSLLQQQQRPTSDRLKTVLASATLENPNDRILNELIGSLALDPSVNVRLTALEALYPHADQEVVRAGVLASLPREQSPLVQVAMIDFLVAARDHAAAPELDRIFRSDTADRNVRAAAMRGLNQL
jgi:HEAT repeats